MKKLDLIIIISVAVFAALIIYFAIAIRTEGSKCIIDPMTYASNKYNWTCFCFEETIEAMKAQSVVREKYAEVNYTWFSDVINYNSS